MDLEGRWKTKKNIIEMDKDEWEEAKRGRYLYYKCQDEDVNMGVIVTPRSFKNGCYHELADQQQIGSTIKFQFDLDPFQKHIQTAHHLQYIPARSFQPSHKVNY